VAHKDGRTEEMQSERQDADRFANQLTPRNRMFRNYAQDVLWEWAEGQKGGKGWNVAHKDVRIKEKQELLLDSQIQIPLASLP